MSWIDWVPALTSSTALGVLGFVLGTVYKARIEKGIQHSFDSKLEHLKSTIRRNDEQISALQAGALAALAGRQANLDKRRIEAIERVWEETIAFAKYKPIVMLAGVMDTIMDSAAGSGPDANKVREFAELILKSADLSTSKPMSTVADSKRPFLNPVCWALFSAYRQAHTYPAALMQLAKIGMVSKEMHASTNAVLTALKVALPDKSTYINQHGLGAIFHVLQPLEDKLLAELVASLSGREASDAAIKQAAEIIEKVHEADAAMKSDPEIPF